MRPWQYKLARNLLFKLDAEYAHHLSLDLLKFSEKIGLLAPLSGSMPETDPVECMGLTFPNPVGLAAGLDKEGDSIDALGRLGFGFVEIGTITPLPQPGNPQPRLFRIIQKEAIINRMGFNNCGVEEGVENVKSARSFEGIVGFNIGKNKLTPNEDAISDYLAALRGCWGVADYVTVNISSRKPNQPKISISNNFMKIEETILTQRPKASFSENDEALTIAIALPGVKKENIKLSAEQHFLTVSVVRERQEEEGLTLISSTVAPDQYELCLLYTSPSPRDRG